MRGPDRPITSMDGQKPFYGASSHGGFSNGGSKENQDGFFVCTDGEARGRVFVAGVLDGHGVNGRRVSDFVKSHLPKRVTESEKLQEDVPRALAAAYSETASALQGMNIDARQSGTTAVTCMRYDNQLFVANVGDSRCVLGREDTGSIRAVALSRDHKPEAPSEKERIFRCGGYVEPTHIPGHGFQGPSRVWHKRQQVSWTVMKLL